jgi:4-hydroxybenzoyl-CoA thioesterase
MTFIKPYLIRLSHVDATGFVFYPHYFHIFNALVEDWFYEALELPYDQILMARGLSLPTVKLETTFNAPCRMGETVDFWLTVSHLGRSSIRFSMGVGRDGENRVRLNRTAVCVSQQNHKSLPIPQDIRDKIAEFMRG